MNKNILVVEDDRDVLDLLSSSLKKAGFSIDTAIDGAAGLKKARENPPDLVLLDLMLPGMSGLEVCRALKGDASTRGVPVIMLTAKADEVDRIVGLELGADDYVTKPFSPREVALRIAAVLRRAPQNETTAGAINAGPITLDRERHVAAINGKELVLTSTEFKLLATLLEKRGRVLSRDKLLNEVWGYESAFDTRTVDTHVGRLREKLGKLNDRIETVRGFGYRMRTAD